MGSLTGNIFDLSALPAVNVSPEQNPTEYLNEPSSYQFDSMLNGAITDGSQIRSDNPESPEPPVNQDKQGATQEKPATRTVPDSQPAKQPVESTTGSKSEVGEEKNHLFTESKKPVLTKSGEERTNRLVRKLAKVNVSDLIKQKTSTKTGPVSDKPVSNVKSASNGKSANISETIKTLTPADENNQTTQVLDKFTVDKVTVKGNEVEILASSTSDKSKTVKVVVPKDQFEGLISPKKGSNESIEPVIGKHTERVQLDGVVKSTPKLNELMDKLNLQEIQVKANVTQVAKASSGRPIAQETTVKLVGADSSAEMLVKGQIQVTNDKTRTNSKKRLAPKGIDLTSPQNSKASAANQNSATAGNGRVSLVNTRNADGGMILKEVKVRPEVMNLAEQFTNEPKTTEAGFDKNFSSVVATESSQTGSTSGSRSELPQVKFSLPDDISQSLKPGGKAVTIKINPELLGPVRLSVRMQNGQLQARLLVDNVQIKSMIESSLDQLTDQLERAGIKVEQLDVNVAGSDVGSELFDRSVAQNRPKVTTRVLDAEEAGVLSTPTEVISRSSGEYVGSSGVNLFA